MSAALLAISGHATIPDAFTFAVATVMILLGGYRVIRTSNPVHAALSLVLTLFGIAVLFIEEDAYFLAAVQIIVYAGAVVVLFLFVIMFLGVDRNEQVDVEPLAGQRPLAAVLVTIAIGGVVALLASAHFHVTGAHTVTAPINGSQGEVGQIGKELFTRYLFAFEATAGLLVIAVVGAVVLARRPPATNEVEAEPETPIGPDTGPADELAGETDAHSNSDSAADSAAAPTGEAGEAGEEAAAEADVEPLNEGAGAPR